MADGDVWLFRIEISFFNDAEKGDNMKSEDSRTFAETLRQIAGELEITETRYGGEYTFQIDEMNVGSISITKVEGIKN